jgi:hypothetical protein
VGGEPDGVLQAEVGDVVQEQLRAATGIGPDQHLATLGFGELFQRGIQGGDVVVFVPR